jgi:hypothetical protein
VIPRREFLNVELASLEAEYQSIVSRRAARAPVVSAGRTGAARARPGNARAGNAKAGNAKAGNARPSDAPRG